ncbi:hypothetical protein DFH09DRAFT_1075270 [Mycena vulgaris]|nr:hypothetical protein DFH09DRAFT_1075270 [Mycena vulgaris]
MAGERIRADEGAVLPKDVKTIAQITPLHENVEGNSISLGELDGRSRGGGGVHGVHRQGWDVISQASLVCEGSVERGKEQGEDGKATILMCKYRKANAGRFRESRRATEKRQSRKTSAVCGRQKVVNAEEKSAIRKYAVAGLGPMDRRSPATCQFLSNGPAVTRLKTICGGLSDRTSTDSQPPTLRFTASVNTATRNAEAKARERSVRINDQVDHLSLKPPPSPVPPSSPVLPSCPLSLPIIWSAPAISYAVFKAASPVADCMSRLSFGGIVTYVIPANPSMAPCLKSAKRLRSNTIKSTARARDSSLQARPYFKPFPSSIPFKSFKYHPSPLKSYGLLQAATATQEARRAHHVPGLALRLARLHSALNAVLELAVRAGVGSWVGKSVQQHKKPVWARECRVLCNLNTMLMDIFNLQLSIKNSNYNTVARAAAVGRSWQLLFDQLAANWPALAKVAIGDLTPYLPSSEKCIFPDSEAMIAKKTPREEHLGIDMHPSLMFQNLSRLPASVQPVAIRAANGSLEDLEQLFSLMEDGQPEMDYILCLPVFYANLNPAPDTPTEGGDLASISNTRAILSLRALGLVKIRFALPEPAAADLWPRMWKWYSWLHNYHDSLPHAPTELDVCGDLLLFLGSRFKDPSFVELVSSTVGVRTLIARGWKLYFQEENHPPMGYLASMELVLVKIKMADPANLDEFIEGAGGRLEDVAALITQSIDYFLPTTRTVIDTAGFLFIDAVFHPLDKLNVLDARTRQAFVAAGIVTSLVNVVCSFSASTVCNTADLLLAALTLLRRVSEFSAREGVIRDAVGAGLLRAVVSCGIRGVQSECTAELLTIIFSLNPFTIYHSVLSRIAHSLRDIEDLLAHPSFRTSAIFEAWAAFRTLAEERLALTNVRKSAEYIFRRPCGNMECGEIRQKTVFGCCGGCNAVYYCSPICQRETWRRGGHRAQCDLIRTFKADRYVPRIDGEKDERSRTEEQARFDLKRGLLP